MSDKALRSAQEQADEYDGFARSGKITARKSGEVFDVPNPMFFDDDMLAEYQALHHRMNQCDRWPDTEVPEQSVETAQPDGTVVKSHIGAHIRRGEYIEPYQETGPDGVAKLVDPPYEVQVAKIVLGDRYAAFKAGGGSSRELAVVLRKLRERGEEREAADPKSAGGSADSAAVAAGDSE